MYLCTSYPPAPETFFSARKSKQFSFKSIFTPEQNCLSIVDVVRILLLWLLLVTYCITIQASPYSCNYFSINLKIHKQSQEKKTALTRILAVPLSYSLTFFQRHWKLNRTNYPIHSTLRKHPFSNIQNRAHPQLMPWKRPLRRTHKNSLVNN